MVGGPPPPPRGAEEAYLARMAGGRELVVQRTGGEGVPWVALGEPAGGAPGAAPPGKRRKIATVAQLAAAPPERSSGGCPGAAVDPAAVETPAWPFPLAAAGPAPRPVLRVSELDAAAWYLMAGATAARGGCAAAVDAAEAGRQAQVLLAHALPLLATVGAPSTPLWATLRASLRLARSAVTECGASAGLLGAALRACVEDLAHSDTHLRALGVILGDDGPLDASPALAAVGTATVGELLADLMDTWLRVREEASTAPLYRVTYALRGIWRRCPVDTRPPTFIPAFSERIVMPHGRLDLAQHAGEGEPDVAHHSQPTGPWLLCHAERPPSPPPDVVEARRQVPLPICYLLKDTEDAGRPPTRHRPMGTGASSSSKYLALKDTAKAKGEMPQRKEEQIQHQSITNTRLLNCELTDCLLVNCQILRCDFKGCCVVRSSITREVEVHGEVIVQGGKFEWATVMAEGSLFQRGGCKMRHVPNYRHNPLRHDHG